MNITWQWKKFEDISGSEMHELLSTRQQVFIIEQKCFYLDADEYDEKSWHLIGRCSDSKIVAYARLNYPDTKYKEVSFGRVLTTKEGRGIGAGRKLIELCIKKSKEEFFDSNIKISAQSYLIKFYSDFGFKITSDPYQDAGVEHVDMVYTQ